MTKNKVDFNCIEKAVSGCEEEIVNIINNYENYIKKLCTTKMINNDGSVYYYYDEDLAQKIRIRLILSIQKFKIKKNDKAVNSIDKK